MMTVIRSMHAMRWGLLAATLLLVMGCGEATGIDPGPRPLTFRTFAQAPTGQTISRVLATTPVAGQMFLLYAAGDDLYGTIGPGVSGATIPPQTLLSGLSDIGDYTAKAVEIRQGRVLFVVSSGAKLWAGVWTALPTTTPSYTFGPVTEITAGDDLARIGNFEILSEVSFEHAFVVYTTTDDPSLPAVPRVQLRVMALENLLNNIPQPRTLTSSTPGIVGSLALSGTTNWDGRILGGHVDANGNPDFLLGQIDDDGDSVDLPAARTIVSGALEPITTIPVYEPFRITSHTFFPPPTVELCDEGDGLFHKDHWLVSPHGGLAIALTETTERKFNCPDDPSQLLFEGTRWVLASPGDRRLIFDDRPHVVISGTAGVIFVIGDDPDAVTAYEADDFTDLGDLPITTPPTGFEADHFIGLGGEEIGLIRLIGHTNSAVWFADSDI